MSVYGMSRKSEIGISKLPRRRFLQVAMIVAGGAIATGAGVWALLPGGDDTDGIQSTDFGPLLVFDQARAATVFAFADAALPPGSGFPDAGEARVIQRLDEELYFVSAEIRSDFRTVIDALDLLPIVYGYFSTFTALNRNRRLEFLRQTQATSSETVRVIVGSLRMAVMMMYYGHASAWSAIGYDGPFEKDIDPVRSEQRDHYAERIGRAGPGGPA